MAEEIENATKQIIVGRSVDGKYITIRVDDDGNALSKLVGFEIPSYDYIALTYFGAGDDGEGEIETVVYKTGGAGGTTVATLTLAYNASNEISSITKT